MKILVVDDSSTMIRIIKNTLNKYGYTDVLEASNGIQGLSKLGEGGVNLIITDWNMPEMDGLTFTKQVRASDKFKGIPILMVTTEGEKERFMEALKAGVTNYIVKPFQPEKLKEKLDGMIKK
ncbi:MAG: response regulator [bacterium]